MKKNKNLGRCSVAVLLCCAMISANAAAAEDNDKASVATGFDYSTGNYGTANSTSILSIPAIAKYETDLWSLKLTVPYLSVSSTGTTSVVPGAGGGNRKQGATSANKVTTQSGLGDIVVASTYYAVEGGESKPGLDLTLKIKMPTADKNAGLGTGETDYAVQMDGYQSFNKVTATAMLGRKILGSSAELPLYNIFYGALGVSYKISDKVTSGVTLDAAQATTAVGTNAVEISAFISRKLDKGKKIQGYVLKGLTDGSPDTGLGGLITFSW